MTKIEGLRKNQKIQQVTGTAAKAVNDLRNLGQFADPEKRKTAYGHGRKLALSLLEPDKNTAEREHEIEKSLVSMEFSDGTMFFTSHIQLPTLVLPSTTQIMYVLPYEEPETQLTEPSWYVIGPATPEDGSSPFPAEGFQSHIGIHHPFMTPEPSSQIQHGGMLVDNTAGSVSILSFPELQAKIGKPLAPSQYLVASNWYMDSNNQEEVTARPNLRVQKHHNVIGIMRMQDETTKLYTISNYHDSVKQIYNRIGIPFSRQRYTSAPALAAMSNVVAKEIGAESWRLCGLENNHGGTYITPDQTRQHFRVYTNI